MFRLTYSHTLLSQVAEWFFVAVLFCDSANLDDMISGSIVFHDDIEILAADLSASEGADATMYRAEQCSTGATGVRQSTPLSTSQLTGPACGLQHARPAGCHTGPGTTGSGVVRGEVRRIQTGERGLLLQTSSRKLPGNEEVFAVEIRTKQKGSV